MRHHIVKNQNCVLGNADCYCAIIFLVSQEKKTKLIETMDNRYYIFHNINYW